MNQQPLNVALLGNPNTGKTTLFNRLTGLRHKTSNFAGTTLDARVGILQNTPQNQPIELTDLPGIYSLELNILEARVVRETLAGTLAPGSSTPTSSRAPDGLLVVCDATNLSQNLMLVGEALRRRLPTVVALNMIDLASKSGIKIDTQALSQSLGCPVIPISARTGHNQAALLQALTTTVTQGVVPTHTPPGLTSNLRAWADNIFIAAATLPDDVHRLSKTDQADRLLTHPVLGLLSFAMTMAALFAVIFWLAQYPMGWIESLFAFADAILKSILPPGLIQELLTDGVMAGVGSTVVFLPQICLLFLLISILEDTGYLARAALLMDRLLRPFGLPGHAFVPLLSSHACALPGIMATRTIPDPRERLATILVAPFVTCSARLPVYVLLTGLLFPDKPIHAALAFIGCYALGIFAAIFSALLARRTILRGKARPMAIELPSYKLPSLKTALLSSLQRGWIFLKKAGSAILAICIILWWLNAFPHAKPTPQAESLRNQAQALVATNTTNQEQADQLLATADHLDAKHAAANSYLGKIGHAAQPLFAPIGADWQLTVGILASFAAREVFVGTMSVIVAGAEESDDDAQNQRIRDELKNAKREDSTTLVFNTQTNWAMLVFYVLAMQCLPTLVVTARESGKAKWALLQFAWMSAVAYLAALIAYNIT